MAWEGVADEAGICDLCLQSDYETLTTHVSPSGNDAHCGGLYRVCLHCPVIVMARTMRAQRRHTLEP
jgi:hypothetical protein